MRSPSRGSRRSAKDAQASVRAVLAADLARARVLLRGRRGAKVHEARWRGVLGEGHRRAGGARVGINQQRQQQQAHAKHSGKTQGVGAHGDPPLLRRGSGSLSLAKQRRALKCRRGIETMPGEAHRLGPGLRLQMRRWRHNGAASIANPTGISGTERFGANLWA